MKKTALNNYSKRKGRILKIDDVEWKWRLGKNSVVAYSDMGEKRTGAAWYVKNVSPEVWERGCWKKTEDGQITPINVKRWLLSWR